MQTPISFIAKHRLVNQQIASTKFSKAADIVGWLAAMQAQEYAQAKWAIGLRLPGSTDSEIEKALSQGSILRTHLLRPTWHFVAAKDIRWMLQLTAPRVAAANAFMYRKLNLDGALFKRSNDTIQKTLEGGNQLTRTELQAVLALVGISVDGFHLSYLMMQAELDGIICSGARQGKQFTYALLEERVPSQKPLHREEALAELSLRYFSSRGPASIQDFATWSGLTIKDAKAGAGMLPDHFARNQIDGQEYYYPQAPPPENFDGLQSTFLMPDYDEYGMGYKNRTALFGPKNPGLNPQFSHSVIIDGVIAGSWKRTGKNKETAEISTYFPLDETQQSAVRSAVKRYETFASD